MWIRSKSKERLIKCDEFIVSKGVGNFMNKYSIYTFGAVHLGAYSTKEKALKVLNAIQECIDKKYNGVFQMPQDSEVE